jgi:hypothetical protein
MVAMDKYRARELLNEELNARMDLIAGVEAKRKADVIEAGDTYTPFVDVANYYELYAEILTRHLLNEIMNDSILFGLAALPFTKGASLTPVFVKEFWDSLD